MRLRVVLHNLPVTRMHASEAIVRNVKWFHDRVGLWIWFHWRCREVRTSKSGKSMDNFLVYQQIQHKPELFSRSDRSFSSPSNESGTWQRICVIIASYYFLYENEPRRGVPFSTLFLQQQKREATGKIHWQMPKSSIMEEINRIGSFKEWVIERSRIEIPWKYT